MRWRRPCGALVGQPKTSPPRPFPAHPRSLFSIQRTHPKRTRREECSPLVKERGPTNGTERNGNGWRRGDQGGEFSRGWLVHG